MVDTVGMANSAPTPTTLQYSGRQARQLNGTSLAGATAARPLGVLTGVRPGTPASTVTATSTTWTCQPHAGVADVMVAAESGGYPFSFDAVHTGAMTAADASNPRIDIIYDQIIDPENGSTTPSASPGYLAGIAAATPAPKPAPAGAFVIAQINVPKVGGGSPTVTWVAPYTVAAGAPIPVPSKAAGDALYAFPGLKRWRLDKGREETYFDTTTKAVAGWYQTGGNPEIGTLAPASTAFTTYSLTKQNGMVTLTVEVPTLAVGGTLITTLPAGFRPPAQRRGGAWSLGASSTPLASAAQITTAGDVYGYTATASSAGFSVTISFLAVDTPVAD